MAESKAKKAMINDGKNVELDGVTVINEGISLSEVKKEETKVEVAPVVSDETVIPEIAAATEIPTSEPVISPIDVPVAPVDIPVVPVVEPSNVMQAVDYNQPIAPTQSFGSSFSADAIVGSNDFNASFDGVSYEKVETTIVTEEDAKKAREAYLNMLAELYDKGPAKQIEILMKVAAKMDELLEVIANQGFVSGPNHEAIKDVRKTYRGLVEKENVNTYSDIQGPSYGSFVA